MVIELEAEIVFSPDAKSFTLLTAIVQAEPTVNATVCNSTISGAALNAHSGGGRTIVALIP